jgi:hypothetical protein
MSDWSRAMIAAVQVLGGLTGVYSAAGALAKQPGDAWAVVIIVGGGCLCALSIAAGMLLFRGHAAGRPLSIVVQAAQVVHLSTDPFRILIRIGVAWVVGLQGTDVTTSVDLGSEFYLSVGHQAVTNELLVNLIACAALFALLRARPKEPGSLSPT